MYTLILDSATKTLYVALLKDNNVLKEIYLEGRNDHAKNIVLKVEEILNDNNIKAFDLDDIIVGIGPGSYTGVRMAVTVCKMLSVFGNKNLYSISTLKLMASGYKGNVLARIDARRGNSFGMILNTNNDEYVLDEGMYDTNELLNKEHDFYVTEDNIKVDPIYCLNHKVKVDEPHLLVPNYLRDTEAERNLHDKKN